MAEEKGVERFLPIIAVILGLLIIGLALIYYEIEIGGQVMNGKILSVVLAISSVLLFVLRFISQKAIKETKEKKSP